ncbi:MAG TPA: metalloregulator ArsR/SmtB family transcription factor [Candidatus Competibacteraceae bacterium]|nr:metalloregulator ArsR/SmtB family transcription factor [Candidatus Competibacteraceae bacterium]
MDAEPDIAGIAALIGDSARAAMLWTLLDGRARPAGELAYRARISAQSASQHLAKLVDAGLLAMERQGRHRYFRLANPEVARVIESLAVLAQGRAQSRAQPRSRRTPAELRYARTCYDHLAGELGVRLLERLLAAGYLMERGEGYEVSPSGQDWLRELGVDLAVVRSRRRRFACPCADWSEHRPHLGGALGAALLQAFLQRDWLRCSRDSRAVLPSVRGRTELARRLPGVL